MASLEEGPSPKAKHPLQLAHLVRALLQIVDVIHETQAQYAVLCKEK